MKTKWLLFGLLAAWALYCATAGRANAEPHLIQPIFVPVIVVYQNGSFTSVQLAGEEWFDNLTECRQEAQKHAMRVLESATVDRYTSVKVSCLPVPSKNPEVSSAGNN